MLHVGLYKCSRSKYWYVDIPAALSPTGRRLRKSTGTKNKKVAETIRSKVQDGHLEVLVGFRRIRPYKDFKKDYLDFLEVSKDYSPRTVELYEEVVPRVLEACQWPPTDQELLKYWKGRIEKKEIRPITANKERRAIHAALEWAIARKYLYLNPCSMVPEFELKEGQREVRDDWFTDDEIVKILEHLQKKYHNLVLWAWMTGMRMSECLNLRWEDLDTRVRIMGKGRKVRHIPMSRPMIRILQEIPQEQVGPFPFTRHQVSMAFSRALDSAKIDKGEFHALRDTFARNFILAGGDIYRLAKILGHSSVQVTEKYYAHLVPDDMKTPMDAVEERIVRILSEKSNAGSGDQP